MKWMFAILGAMLLLGALPLRAQQEIPIEYGYLMERISVPMEGKLYEYSPATRVMVVGEKDEGKLTIRISGREFDVPASQVPRDSGVAQALLTKMAEEKKKNSQQVKVPGEPPAGPTALEKVVATKLDALQKQEGQVRGQMERIRNEMKNIPYKLKPWSQMDYANNARHDELKKQLQGLELQHSKIMDQERGLRREMKSEQATK